MPSRNLCLEYSIQGGKFESLSIQMTAVMGSIAKGQEAVKWVKDFAKNTPFQLGGVSKAFIKLKAFGLDPVNGTMQALADQTAKMGGGQQELEGIVLALGQAWSKQKLQAEEANQLLERGVPVWELMSKAIGKTTAETQKMATAGQLGRTEIKLLIDEIGRSSEGAAKAQMSAWTGLVSNISDVWDQFLNRIAESGTLDYFKQQLDDLLKKTEEMANNGELQKIAQQISDFFTSTSKTISETIGFISKYSGVLKGFLGILAGAKFAGFISGLRGIGTQAVSSSANLATASTAAGKLKTSLGGVTAAIRASLYGVLATQIFGVIDAYQQLQAQQIKLASAEKELGLQNELNVKKLKAIADALDLNITKYGNNQKAIIKAIEARRQEIAATENSTKSLRDFDAEIEQVINSQRDLVSVGGKTVAEMTAIGTASDQALQKFNGWSDGSKKGIDSVAEGLKTLSDTELVQLKKSLTEAFDSAINKSFELEQAIAQIDANELERSFQNLGVTSSFALDQTARKARESFEIIKASGQATTDDLAEAFRGYAKKAIEANDGVATEALKTEAAFYDVLITSEKATNSIVSGSEKSIVAQGKLKGSVDKVTTSFEEQALAAKKADEAAKNAAEAERQLNDEFDRNVESNRGSHTNNTEQFEERSNEIRERLEKENSNDGRRPDGQSSTKFSQSQNAQLSELSEDQFGEFQKRLDNQLRNNSGRLNQQSIQQSVDFILSELKEESKEHKKLSFGSEDSGLTQAQKDQIKITEANNRQQDSLGSATLLAFQASERKKEEDRQRKIEAQNKAEQANQEMQRLAGEQRGRNVSDQQTKIEATYTSITAAHQKAQTARNTDTNKIIKALEDSDQKANQRTHLIIQARISETDQLLERLERDARLT